MRRKGMLAKGALVVCLVLALLSALGARPAGAADTIKIGHVCSITGWAGMLGSPQRDAMLAMVDDVNKRGGLLGKQVEALIEDDQSNPTTAVIAATKLVRDKKVDVLVGTTLSDCAMAVSSLAEQELVPYIVTSPVVLPFKKWVFPIGPGDVKMAAHVVEMAVNTLGAKRIGLLHDTALYGMQGAKIFNRDVGKYGASIIIEQSFDVKDTDVVPQLTKIKAAKPDLFVLYSTGAACVVVAKNYKQLGMTTQVLGAGGLAGPDFLKNAGNMADEMNWVIAVLKISIAESLPPNDSYRKSVYEPALKIFEEKYGAGKSLNVFHVSPMDAFTMAELAMKAAGSDDRVKVRDALEKVKFMGLLGYVAPDATDHQGGNVDTSSLALFKNGQFVPYKK